MDLTRFLLTYFLNYYLRNYLLFGDITLHSTFSYGHFPVQFALQSYVPSIFCFSKETERIRTYIDTRIYSVGFASPEACSIVSSMKHTSPVVRLDFPIHLPLSLLRLYPFLSTSLCVYISSVDAVEYDKVEFQHMALSPSRTR